MKLAGKYLECFGIEFAEWFLNLETDKVDGKNQRDKCVDCPVFNQCFQVTLVKTIGSEIESNHALSRYLCEVISFFAKSEKEVQDLMKQKQEEQNDPDNRLPPEIREWEKQANELGFKQGSSFRRKMGSENPAE